MFNTINNVTAFLDSVQNHLLHPHTWVRHASSKLFGLLFASCSVDTLVPVLLEENDVSDKNNVCIQFFNGGKLQTVKRIFTYCSVSIYIHIG